MAEQEIRKHSRNALNVLQDKEKNFIHKMKDFCVEIFIIVFAVSLSIWLHGLSEEHHQQNEVKEFLADLREDLKSDKADILRYKKELQQRYGKLKNEDTLYIKKGKGKDNNGIINLGTYITRKTNLGIYEGFKSSGNITHIEDRILKNNILKYYEQESKILEKKESNYNEQRAKILNLVLKSKDDEDLYSNKDLLDIYVHDVISQYNTVLQQNEDIIKSVNNKLNNY